MINHISAVATIIIMLVYLHPRCRLMTHSALYSDVTRPNYDAHQIHDVPMYHLNESKLCCVRVSVVFYNPGIAETLNMRHERETLGFLPQKARVSPWLRMFGKQ